MCLHKECYTWAKFKGIVQMFTRRLLKREGPMQDSVLVMKYGSKELVDLPGHFGF